jgi:zinc transporter 2/zinc transporter 4
MYATFESTGKHFLDIGIEPSGVLPVLAGMGILAIVFLRNTNLGVGLAQQLSPEPQALKHDDLPLPVVVRKRHKVVKMPYKKQTISCSSSMHTPGVCNGFDVHRHLKSGKKGAWSLAHCSNEVAIVLQQKSAQEQRRAVLQPLAISTLAATFIMVVELLCGLRFSSLALLSDSAHQLSDVALYLGLLFAVKLSEGNADYKTFSYGFERAQILGAFIALLLQYVFLGLLVVSAAGALLRGQPAADTLSETGAEVFTVGVLTLLLNIVLLWALPSSHELSHGHSHGAWGVARLHLLGDLIQGCAVMLSGMLRWMNPRWGWADPATTFVYAGVVIAMSWHVFRGLLFCLMERTPDSVDAGAMFDDLANIASVIDVHCFHVWTIAPGKFSMTAHLHIEDDDVHEDVLTAAKILLKHKYGIAHSTLQISSDEDMA